MNPPRLTCNKMVFTVGGLLMTFVVLGFASLPIYQKQPNQVTDFERSWTHPSEESYQLVRDRDYIGFSLYLMKAVMPSIIGAALATLGNDIDRDRKKNKKY